MITKKHTVDYNDKVKMDCNKVVDEILSELPSYCTDFNNSRELKKQPRTQMENARDLKVFFTWLHANNSIAAKYEIKEIPYEILSNLNGFDFDAYVNYLAKTNKKAAIKRKLSSIRPFFKFLYTRGFIDSDPSQMIDLPQLPKKRAVNTIILEKEERPKFYAAIDEAIVEANESVTKALSEGQFVPFSIRIAPATAVRNKAMIYLLIHTGIRVSELCAINCTDFNTETGKIRIIRKGGSEDSVYVAGETMEYLLSYLYEYREQLRPDDNNYDALFIGAKGSRISPRGVELAVKAIAKKALGEETKISPHKLRATFGTEYYNQTHDINATAKSMGHASMQTTSTYYVREDEEAKMQATQIKI